MDSNLIEQLDRLDQISSLEEKVFVLNQSLNLLDSPHTEYILFKNLVFSLIESHPGHHDYKAIDYIANNEVKFHEHMYKIHAMTSIFSYFRKKVDLQLEEYFHLLTKCLENIGESILDSEDCLKPVILNNLLDKYSIKSYSKIVQFLYDKEILYNRDSIQPFQYQSLFENFLDIDPMDFAKYFQIRDFNLFLRSSKSSFSKGNPNHEKWIDFFIKYYFPINFVSFYPFNKEHNHYKVKEYFFTQSKSNFLKELINSQISIENYGIEDSIIEKSENLSEIVFKFYGHGGKKLVSLVAALCTRGESFNFSYLYLGQIISSNDVNYLHSYLLNLLETGKNVNLVRASSEKELFVLQKIKPYFPKKLNGFFKETQFNNIYVILHRFKDYIDKVPQIYPEHNFERLVSQIDAKIEYVKSNGYNLTYGPKEKQLDEKMIGSLEIKLPKTDKELFSWGQSLRNCLIYANWALKVYEKNSTIFALTSHGFVEYVVEIDRDFKILQMEGFNRSKPEEGIRAAVEQFLKD